MLARNEGWRRWAAEMGTEDKRGGLQSASERAGHDELRSQLRHIHRQRRALRLSLRSQTGVWVSLVNGPGVNIVETLSVSDEVD